MDVELVLGDVDSDIGLHRYPSLQMRAHFAAQATVRVEWKSGWGSKLCRDLARSGHNRAPTRCRSRHLTTTTLRRYTSHFLKRPNVPADSVDRCGQIRLQAIDDILPL